MGHPRYSSEEIVNRGRAIYDEQLRSRLEPEHIGKFLRIDIETADFEMDANEIAASRRAHEKHPDGAFFGMRAGYRTSGSIGLLLKGPQQ